MFCLVALSFLESANEILLSELCVDVFCHDYFCLNWTFSEMLCLLFVIYCVTEIWRT